MDLPGSIILRNFLYFLKRKLFLYFGKRKLPKIPYILRNENPKNILTFQEVTFLAQEMKKSHSEKTALISGNGTF